MTGPLTGSTGISYTFSITVSPAAATVPFSYTFKATDITTQTLVTNSALVTARYRWATPGVKTIVVQVNNEFGAVINTHTITLEANASGSGGASVYLPLVTR